MIAIRIRGSLLATVMLVAAASVGGTGAAPIRRIRQSARQALQPRHRLSQQIVVSVRVRNISLFIA